MQACQRVACIKEPDLPGEVGATRCRPSGGRWNAAPPPVLLLGAPWITGPHTSRRSLGRDLYGKEEDIGDEWPLAYTHPHTEFPWQCVTMFDALKLFDSLMCCCFLVFERNKGHIDKKRNGQMNSF